MAEGPGAGVFIPGQQGGGSLDTRAWSAEGFNVFRGKSQSKEQADDISRNNRSERRKRSLRTEQTEETSHDVRPGRVPESLPYSTAASEFLYGYSSVLAALKVNRRNLYKLYIHNRGLDHEGKDAIVQNARLHRLSVQEVGDEYLRAFDKASNGRPHNGFILEASPLPVPPITELLSSSLKAGTFELTLDKQTKEDAMVNGTKEKYSYKSAGWRHPLVLYVDGVLDEGNLGAIARSAYFLGVDAIVTPSRQSAPWSHIALKASAGAAEAIPIFKVNQPADFLGRSAREGWRIYASDAIPPAEQRPHSVSPQSEPSVANLASSVIYAFAKSTRRLPVQHCPVENHPTILMMGGEGSGLRTSLINAAHYKVGIRHGRDVDEVGVDSLNVSVAASLLCFHILQKPQPRQNAGGLLF
ncbi:alpha/beta knot [Lentithecium fluviatile CBS 122367]|uniref:rRNA methyltransferase 1, mitochondrial n=1 Tax=Lentithecium fluviatile CBS 122367 TaxID=1168545 RepID=A0A6G1JIY0_9PLEO|nr:alpha/beta knot [Lentithecium fluviatile CBS 122367]